MNIRDDIDTTRRRLLDQSREPYPTGPAALGLMSPADAGTWSRLLQPHIDAAGRMVDQVMADLAVHTNPPPALDPANVRAAIARALGRDPRAEVLDELATTDMAGRVARYLDRMYGTDPRPTPPIRADSVLYVAPWPDDGTGWTAMGTVDKDGLR